MTHSLWGTAQSSTAEGVCLCQTRETLSHTKWDCKYHVVFIPKYRRKALYHRVATASGGGLSLARRAKRMSY